MKQFSFSKEDKLHFDREFKRVFKKSRAIRNSGLVMFAYRRAEAANIPGNEIGHARLGVVLSRKVGRAVDRNKLKRQLRELFRLNKHALKQDFDIVFLAREKLPPFKYDKLKEIVFNLWQRAAVLK